MEARAEIGVFVTGAAGQPHPVFRSACCSRSLVLASPAVPCQAWQQTSKVDAANSHLRAVHVQGWDWSFGSQFSLSI